MSSPACQTCGGTVEHVLDAGRHPVANHYAASPAAAARRFELRLGLCASCGLVQLTTLVPASELVPPYEWITYNEPEGHLDSVADMLRALPGLPPNALIGAITYKDDSTIARLGVRGLPRSWRIDPQVDLDAPVGAGLETIQDRLAAAAAGLRRKYDQADLLLVRHILEHAQDTRRFAAALRELVRPGGYLVFEVPDCSQVLDTLDYTTIWEEHVLYFTMGTYRRALEDLGFEVVRVDSHPFPYENSLVAVVRNVEAAPGCRDAEKIDADRARARRFASAFAPRRQAVQACMADRTARGSRIAVFGAGHLSCMFINVNDIAHYISFVVDDHPGKRGLFMPGSHVPVRGSDALIDEGIDLCLSSLSPESEEKVVAKQREFIAGGGEFASIFPSSRRALAITAVGGRAAC